MSEEDQQIQDAYNEWLLKYGFRLMHIDVVRKDRPLFWWNIPSDVVDAYTNKQGPCHERLYRLKTPQQLTTEQNEIINPTRTTRETEAARYLTN